MDKRPVVIEQVAQHLYLVCEIEPGRLMIEDRPEAVSRLSRYEHVLYDCPKNWEIGYETKLRDVV